MPDHKHVVLDSLLDYRDAAKAKDIRLSDSDLIGLMIADRLNAIFTQLGDIEINLADIAAKQ